MTAATPADPLRTDPPEDPAERPRARLRSVRLAPPVAEEEPGPAVCPLLGLRDDPQSRALFPRSDHVCAQPGVGSPTLGWQRLYCIGDAYPTCPYLQPPAPRPPTRRRWWQRMSRYWLPTCVTLAALDALAIALVLASIVAGSGAASGPAGAMSALGRPWSPV